MSIFPTKILLATDGSADAMLANETAADLANTTNSELHVVTVAPGALDPTYRIESFVRYEDALKEVEEEARRILNEQVKKIEEAGGKVAEAHLRRGRREDEIVKLAEEIGAGLIVMGSRGLGGVRRALMGSVSDFVVRHAHCPVMIVRR
ncbi:universal stress protein [Rubrobacter taiwanensis]|jgi:nucleotide-binding universal stress UspA family protein|uniref:Universal stress protein n=1 Tax=Rubrobacter taiwanensis TaxID=185139 RepID=A0A4V2NWQ8_9ACTN|nr:universal stress protein [Rubrobacter taiwanensis]TCJ18322.1 universal stress protein [Rubrobacter taiwanensis]